LIHPNKTDFKPEKCVFLINKKKKKKKKRKKKSGKVEKMPEKSGN